MAGKKKSKKADAADEPQSTAAAPSTDVVAWVDGTEVSLSEVDQTIQGRLSKVRQDEYNLRRSALDQLIDTMLLENEAEARGISYDELVMTEINAKAAPVTPQDIERYYNAQKSRNKSLQGKTLEQATPMIERSLSQQRASARRFQYLSELRDANEIKVMLQPPRAVVPIGETDATKGPEGAPIVLVEFSDYQCGYCKRAEATINQILAEYGDNIQFVYRDFALNFHPRAIPAAIAARCAGEQDMYWDFHDNLLEVNGNLSDEDLTKRAQDIQLDMEAFTACYDTSQTEPAVVAGMADGSALGVTGTPTFFINGRMLVGAKPYQEFKDIIEEELDFAETAPESRVGG